MRVTPSWRSLAKFAVSVFQKSVGVPYSEAQAFELVSDVARYPDFIKWITAMRVSGHKQLADGSAEFVGDAAIGFRGFSERFSTKVVSNLERGEVVATLVRGPFKHLVAKWTIGSGEGGGSTIALKIDYEFRNLVLRLLASANEDMAAGRIMDAFLAEAARRYA